MSKFIKVNVFRVPQGEYYINIDHIISIDIKRNVVVTMNNVAAQIDDDSMDRLLKAIEVIDDD